MGLIDLNEVLTHAPEKEQKVIQAAIVRANAKLKAFKKKQASKYKKMFM